VNPIPRLFLGFLVLYKILPEGIFWLRELSS
jgi:hypothetical protein